MADDEGHPAKEKPKVSKASVNYRNSHGRRTCGNCDMFHMLSPPLVGSCDLVRGVIEAADVCSEWVNVAAARAVRGYPYESLSKPKSPGG
jgi:hypothetical protein